MLLLSVPTNYHACLFLLQSISSVRQIADSDCFHTFLMSGVQSLREANVVSNPKKAKRRSFLGIVRTPTGEVQKAEVCVCVRERETVLTKQTGQLFLLKCGYDD